MNNARSRKMLDLVISSNKVDKSPVRNSVGDENSEESIIPDVMVNCHGVLSPSPVPPQAEIGGKDVMLQVWNEAFGEPEVNPAEAVSHSSPDNRDLSVLATRCRTLGNQTPTTGPYFEEELTLFDLDVPPSFENSPAFTLEELQPLSVNTTTGELNIPTPMASPVNSHIDCHDVFCPVHNYEHWTQSSSASGTNSSGPCDSSEDAHSHTPKRRVKRRKRISEWSDAKRKCLKNIGKKYVSKRGKVVDEKTLGLPCSCRYRCYEKISHDQRYQCFKKFWSLGSREKQWAYVVKYTQKGKKNRCLNRDEPNRRQNTYKYTLPLSTNDDHESQCETVSVCKTMFLNTLSSSGRILRTAWDKYDGSTLIEADLRGHHKNHKQVVTADVVNSVCDHVRSFAPVESHYTRKTSTKLYLDGSLSISRMYLLYKEWYDDSKYTDMAVTQRQYREVVTKIFNLGFFIPKKDQCDVCHIYRNKTDHTDQEKTEYEKHLSNKNSARTLKKLDKCKAIDSNGKMVAAVFDFQKVLSCPHGQVSVFYYKRKLSCLNFTVFNMGIKKAVCYMWDETVAKRGANEVASCLLDFVEANATEGVTEFRFWSDNCAGQNRNRFVFFLYVYAATKFNVTIIHRFLEKGHTQNEGDSVHALIERAAQKKTIYTPEEWRLLIRWAKCEGEPYEVKNMTQRHFFDFKSHVNNKTWSKNTKGEKVSWTSIREVYVDKFDTNKLQYKYDFNETDYSTVIIRNNTRRNASTALAALEHAYETKIYLPKDKYKDLMSMCDSGIIGEQYADFFKSLPHFENNAEINDSDSDE